MGGASRPPTNERPPQTQGHQASGLRMVYTLHPEQQVVRAPGTCISPSASPRSPADHPALACDPSQRYSAPSRQLLSLWRLRKCGCVHLFACFKGFNVTVCCNFGELKNIASDRCLQVLLLCLRQHSWSLSTELALEDGRGV